MERKFEEVLEAIYVANEEKNNSLNSVKHRCHVEITEDMLEQMQKLQLIVKNRQDVFLTQAGHDHASKIVRRKRLAETLLFNSLQAGNEQLEEVSCEFEHEIYPEIEESICILLGHPKSCPHEKPIPAGDCCTRKSTEIHQKLVPLTGMKEGTTGRIAYFKAKDDVSKGIYEDMGLKKGTLLEVGPLSPAVVVAFNNRKIAMDKEVGKNIYLIPQ
ncbi:MAG: metal-dependent transcriptional regulator [Bacteriovoracaceae bacterium]|nr:metal-dependent transcriptional regulator [Bacteriovoracaceae bacterium]